MHPSIQELGVDLSADFDNVQKQLVKDVVKLHHKPIRYALSTMLGRAMQRSHGDEEVTHTVKVNIRDDYPASLVEPERRHGVDLLTAFRLLVQLRRSAEAATYISNQGELVHQLQAVDWLAAPDPARARKQTDLKVAFPVEEVHRLQGQLAPLAADIQRLLYAPDRSVLSAYEPDRGDSSGQVILYWKPIAMVAADPEAETHEIARYTLLHGLAHAHYHLAMDTNSQAWHYYRHSEPAVQEGVAGWYTHQIIRAKEYSLRKAYVKLMTKIPPDGIRLTWQRWHEKKRDNEAVRRAIQRSAHDGVMTLSDFDQLMR